MKNLKKIMTTRLLAAILLLAVCMAGCAAPAEPNSGVPSKTDAPAESDSSGAPADAPQALTLPILDEIDADVAVGTAGSSLLAVQAAVKLLDWGVNTGLDTDEIGTAASVWLSAKNDDRTECLQKLELVDEAYQKLLTDEARELLDSAGISACTGYARSTVSSWVRTGRLPACRLRGRIAVAKCDLIAFLVGAGLRIPGGFTKAQKHDFPPV